jgi:hypothetical protein
MSPRGAATPWSHPGSLKTMAILARRWETKECAFEKFVREHNIPEPMWKQSIELRAWCRRHANTRFIPEKLLNHFGISVGAAFALKHLADGNKPHEEEGATA